MSGPHPSWSSDLRRFSRDHCEHGVDWVSRCDQCRTSTAAVPVQRSVTIDEFLLYLGDADADELNPCIVLGAN